MELDDLRLSPKVGKNFVSAAKSVVCDCVKVKADKEFKTIFTHRGFYGDVEYSDMLTLIAVRVVKKLQNKVSDADYKLVESLNKTNEKYHGILELNESRNTCSARAVLFLEAEFNDKVFLGALNDCCDNLETFFRAYDKKMGDKK